MIALCDKANESEVSLQQMIRLQQVHYTRCEEYFEDLKAKMILSHQEFKRVRNNLEALNTEELLKLE